MLPEHDLNGINYADCGLCLLILADCADVQETGCTKYFYADEGSVTIDQFGQDGGTFSGSMSNVVFKEVTIDSETYTSTPVSGGETWCMDGTSFFATVGGATNPGNGDNGSGNTGGDNNDGGTTSGDCPPNSHPGDPSVNSGEQSGYCYCDEGYFVNEEGTGCVAECETDADCDGGDVCIDNSCRPAPVLKILVPTVQFATKPADTAFRIWASCLQSLTSTAMFWSVPTVSFLTSLVSQAGSAAAAIATTWWLTAHVQAMTIGITH